MRLFDAPYPHDFIFFKVAGEKRVSFMPLCEALAVVSGAVYDSKSSTKELMILIEPVKNGKIYKIKREDLIARLQHDIYKGTKKIIDYVIQPEGEMQLAEVTQFLERN